MASTTDTHGPNPPGLSRRSFFSLGALGLLTAQTGCTRRGGDGGRGVTLSMSDWGGATADPNMARFEREVTAEWGRLHPDIRVVPEHIPGSGEYVPKLLTAFVAGTAPDVMAVDASYSAAFTENGCLLDLTPLVKRDRLDLSVYYPNVLDLARRGGKLYALPGDFTPMMLYYNRRLFEKAGHPFPRDGWTWQEFRAACEALTVTPRGATRPTQYGFQLQNWMPGWIPWVWQNGADVISPDGRRATGYFDAPATAEAITFLSSLVRDRLAPSLSETQAQGVDPFQAGLTAMQVSGHWNIVGLKASERIQLEDIGVVGLPRHRTRATVLYEQGYAITSQCRNVDAAWEYVKFMAGPFVQRKKAELGIGITARRAIAEAHRNDTPLEPVFLDNVRYGRAPHGARVENYAPLEDLGKEALDAVLIGGQSPQSALHEAARRADAELGAI